MFYLNDGYSTLSLEETAFNRNDSAEIDAYDYFSTDIQLKSEVFSFSLKNIDVYIFHLKEIINGINLLIKEESAGFVLSLYHDVMVLNFQRNDDGISYCITVELKSLTDGEFSLKGNMYITNDTMVGLYNDIKYFLSAYE